MNNRLHILAAVLCILAVSCGIKEQEEAIPSFGGYEQFYATIEQPAEAGTKTFTDNDLHVLWHEDDRVTIFNKFSYNQEYAFTGETGDNSGGFSKVSGDEFVTGFDLVNVYSVYPFQKSTKIDSDGKMTITLPAGQAWAERSFGRGANTMIAAAADNKLKFKNIGGLLVLKLYGAGVQVSSVTLKGNAGELIAGKASVTMAVDGYPEVEMQEGTDAITVSCESPVALGSSEAYYTEFWFVIPPVDFTKGFTITVTGADGGTFEKSTDKSVTIGRNHISRMAPIEVILKKPAAEPEWVDLGLSVKWATFNVGATKPEEYGDYFAWGETEPKEDYSWSTYRWGNGNTSSLTKYNTNSYYGTADNKTVLDSEDDAAHVNWGGSWRIPTDAEWTELRENCTWTWTSNYNGTGVAGRIVTSNKSGYTNKSIFLPASGQRDASRLFDASSYGYYWLSSLDSGYPIGAYYGGFDSSDVYRGLGQRDNGHSVRPVFGESAPPEQTFYIDSWELNPDSIIGTMGKLNMTRPSDDAYYGDEPYKTYGSIGLYSPKEKDRTAIVGHFKEYSKCWKDVDDNATFSFKVCNFKKDVVDIVAGGTNTSTGNDNGYAKVNLSGSDLKKIRGGMSISPEFLFRNPDAMTSDVDVLVEVTETHNGSSSARKGYYYLSSGATRYNQIEFTGQGAELGAFPDCNDYILIHELVPDIYIDGKKIVEWDADNGKWAITADGRNLGLQDPNIFVFRINKLIYDKSGKDTEDSFGGWLYFFEAGDTLYPWPGIVQEGGIGFGGSDDGRALMHDKTARYEIEVYYEYESLVKIINEIKVLASGKKAHPYHKSDGTWWD